MYKRDVDQPDVPGVIGDPQHFQEEELAVPVLSLLFPVVDGIRAHNQ